METKRAERGAQTRERLLAAAQELFWEQGVAATTPRQVLERSGVGQGSLYHHFPSKRHLALAGVQRTAEDTLGSARAVLGGAGAPMERLRAYLTRPREAVAGCRVGRLTGDPAVMADPELRAPVEEYFTRLIGLVAELFVEAGQPQPVATRRAQAVIAVIQGGYVLSRALDDPAPMHQATDGLAHLLEQTR